MFIISVNSRWMKEYWQWIQWNGVFPRMVWWRTHRATSEENRIECLLFHRFSLSISLSRFLCQIAPEYNLVYNLCFVGIRSQFLANGPTQCWCTGNINRRYHCLVCEHESRLNERMNEWNGKLLNSNFQLFTLNNAFSFRFDFIGFIHKIYFNIAIGYLIIMNNEKERNSNRNRIDGRMSRWIDIK